MSFTVYKSSAGSGKTFTLVKEYLKLVLTNPGVFRHILAITFTNKAANEMKQRILDALLGIGQKPENQLTGTIRIMFDQITKETGLPESQIRENAGIVSTLILHNYNDFAISTIDSFVHRVIRSFSFDLHLPLNFEVELKTEDVLRKAIQVLISRVGYDQKLTDLLVAFVQSKTDEEKSWKIEEDLYNVAKQLLNEESQVHIQKLQNLTLEQFSEINKKIISFLAQVEKSWQETAAKANGLITSEEIPLEDLYYGTRGIGAYFDNLASGRFDKIEPNSNVRKTIDEDKWHSPNADGIVKDKIDRIKPQLIDFYNAIAGSIEKNFKTYILFGEIRKNIYPLAILNEIEKIVQDYKSENGILLISEFNRKIAGIALNEPVPFIYERLGEKYRHFMVDEFQDTSILQWQNLLPLIENSLASGYFNMVVGDAKQAIYRWRSGEVEQFVALPRIYKNSDKAFAKERELAFMRNYSGQSLNHNFRSRVSVVEFNNDFFETVSGILSPGYQEIYRDVRQISNPAKAGGYVEITFFGKDEETDDFMKFNLTKIIEVISDTRSKGYGLKDIAILCRNNKNAAFIASELLKEGIRVISSESLLLSNSGQVRLILAMARFVANPLDEIARLEIVNWLVNNGLCNPDYNETLNNFGLFKDSAAAIENPVEQFFTALIKTGIEMRPKFLHSLNAYEFCEEVIRIFDLAGRQDGYMTFFLDAVLQQEKKPPFGLKELIRWWDIEMGNLSVVVPEKLDAVRVMTIHKSKGLEFPVVIYPFASEKVRNTKSKLWVDIKDSRLPGLETALLNTSTKLRSTDFADLYEEEAEKSLLDLINLLYVVMTRAEDRLYIIASQPPEKDNGTHSAPKIFKQYLKDKGLWQDNRLQYCVGDPETQGNHLKADSVGFVLNNFYSTDWRERIRLKFHSSGYWGETEVRSNREWGTLVHRLLAEIDAPQDIDAVLEGFFLEGVITREEVDILSETITRFVSKPEVSAFFNKGLKLKKESDILLPDGRSLRPDRVVVEGNKVIVIDFKTGSKNHSDIQQIKEYREILHRMGYLSVEAYLMYVYEDDAVVKV